jgi:predicted hydrocarbon binding protein
VWTLRREADALALTVRNSPFAAGAGRCCAPITGMLQAVGTLVLQASVVAEETDCAAEGAACCRFTARRADPPRAAAAGPAR